MVQPVEAPPVPTPGQLEWLCGALIDALNASPLAFPEPAESLRLAPAAAGLPEAVVKAARYPEWMRAASVSGLFVPLTGEALADATAPAPLIPFTAVHELMHLSGIADEGAANIAAWDRCLAAGGAFADSARLWALRYAMGLLYRVDEEAWQRARDKMKDPLARVYMDCGGEALAGAPRASRFPRLSLQRGDYAALARWLAVKIAIIFVGKSCIARPQPRTVPLPRFCRGRASNRQRDGPLKAGSSTSGFMVDLIEPHAHLPRGQPQPGGPCQSAPRGHLPSKVGAGAGRSLRSARHLS